MKTIVQEIQETSIVDKDGGVQLSPDRAIQLLINHVAAIELFLEQLVNQLNSGVAENDEAQ